MRINPHVFPQVVISLGNSETFLAKAPTDRRKTRVDTIHVHDGFFMLSGTRGNSQKDHEIGHGFRSVDELPQMPLAVQQTVKRLLEQLETLEVTVAIDQLKKAVLP
jgi:hypothetical protein